MTALKKSKEGQGLKKDDLTENIKKVLNIGKNADPDSDPDKLLAETAKLLAEAIEIYVKSGTVETSVQVEILPQSIQSLGSPGATAGPPLMLEVYGDGKGEVK